MSDSEGGSPSDTMSARVDQNRWKLWVLMNANRWLIAALVAFGVFTVLVLISFLDLAPMRLVVANHNSLWWLFSPAVNAVVTGVTLVVTFNQLVLSQELGSLGDQRDRMRGAIDFRDDVDTWLENDVSPPDPASFLESLIDAIQGYANDLDESVSKERDETMNKRVKDYVDSLTDHANSAGQGLSDAQFGTFDVVYSALDFNYSWKIYEAKRLEAAYGAELGDDATEALDNVVQVLEFFGPAREHFKTLYFQWELVNLSRMMLYSAIPALIVTISMMLYVTADVITGTTLGVDNIVWLICGAMTVSLTPFFLLFSYILRIATVAKRTLAIGPFILRETNRSNDIDWE